MTTTAIPVHIPELGELARRVTPATLQTLRFNVNIGDRVAVYVHPHREARLLIMGPQRRTLEAPLRLEGDWKLAGIVRILEDNGEQVEPGQYVA